MIMKVKMCTRNKKFGKICLKAIYFCNIWSAIKGGMERGMNEKERTQFFGEAQSPPQSLA